ncbi:MAG TPA: hypothetical protein VLX58_08835 [Bryobacteraceae bacterium]|nr:hypothetical protein [Bryobacteraceae bacterium]
MVKGAIVAFFVISITVYLVDTMESRYPPGVLIPEEPRQTLPSSTNSWKAGKYQITPLAAFHLRARVLHTEPYWFDHGADLSPVDLALGWGRMSDQSVLDQISFSQGQRWFHYWPRQSRFPIPVDEINSHSANMHMIPANQSVKGLLKSLHAGNLIELNGELVEADGEDGFKWRSSLSRTDTGAGACELVWVEEISAK